MASSHAYSEVSEIPLIKAPSMWLPKPVVLPQDIHPLPEDVTAYFVYPFTLETSCLSNLKLHPQHFENLNYNQSLHSTYLLKRQQNKIEVAERKRRDELRRVAPGWDGGMEGLVVPKRITLLSHQPQQNCTTSVGGSSTSATVGEGQVASGSGGDPMGDVVEGLARLSGLGTE